MRRLLVSGALLALALAATAPASAGTAACDSRSNNTPRKLMQCVTLAGVRAHQAALQAIADANGGTRASGTAGYEASVGYVVGRLEAAGYEPQVQAFEFPFFQELSEGELARVSPDPETYASGRDFNTMQFSGSGEVTAPLQPTNDILLPPGATASTSGCEASDFAGFRAGNIALVQRGTCRFVVKVQNAIAAGASAVVIFNEGPPGETEAIRGTLREPVNVPVVGTSFAVGSELYALTQRGPVAVRIATETLSETRTSWNVLAELAGRNDDNVVMVGAHLDSVLAGPGINDDGSGSAALLEIAEQIAKVKPRNTLRFAWWGAEEAGLFGSQHYVSTLGEDQLADIALYLNFDMVGSPNYVRFVYDGDGSAFDLAGPPGSAAIETLFTRFYAERGLESDPTAIDFRSDYAAFFRAGIPIGGLFTGAEGIKTPAQALLYGGTAGAPYDSCYHEACDTFANVDLDVLELNADAIAFATLFYGMNTASVNGVSGKGNFKSLARALRHGAG